MKPCLAALLACVIVCETFAINSINIIPDLSPDVAVPVTTNTVSLLNPNCYFENATLCPIKTQCFVWLVSSLTSATSTYDQKKLTNGFLAPYTSAYTSTGTGYSTTPINSLDKIPCPGTSPSNFLVGASGICQTSECNGVLPTGANMSFKYILVNNTNGILAETQWSSNIALKNVQSPDSIGNGYAGRSAAMVVITAILSVAAALLLLLLLIALILACCCRRGKTQTHEVRRQTSLIGSLRIPSYDVHNLKNPSPYDNPAYEQELNKKRYTTNSTLPQKTTTVITHVHSSDPDNITLQKM
ncbi:uroplakin-3b [Tachysurus fulvidraco]|uniref:uroplakin-3b n=1 Tax=Tachysurus fulvidraco TaxID=1234273 RepID=UPI000F512072|nr:uroplakin-3b [Tachysurus fulvidraco]